MMKRWLIMLSIGLFVAAGCATGPEVYTPPTVIVTECPKVKPKAPPKHLFVNWKMMELDGEKILYIHENEARKTLLDQSMFENYIKSLFDQLRALDMLEE